MEYSTALLPNGFSDLLPPEAGRECDAITQLLDVFMRFGYSRVKPPLVEFEESLFSSNLGKEAAKQSFRLMDPISHKMMGVRSDVTTQISRIVSSRLHEEARPLRLTYANDVLRIKGSQQRTARQFTQVGCELVGVQDLAADVEICLVALAGIASLEIEALTLDISLPRIVELIFEHYGCDESTRQAVRKALVNRDLDGLKDYGEGMGETFAALLEASGAVEEAIEKLLCISLPAPAAQDVIALSEFYKLLSAGMAELGLSDVTITIDPVEMQSFDYYKGLAFSLFSRKAARGPLGCGGRYEVSSAQEDLEGESACGFTLYMDTLCAAMPEAVQKDMVFVPADENWGVIKELQDKGWIVVRGIGDTGPAAECTHIWKNGEVIRI